MIASTIFTATSICCSGSVVSTQLLSDRKKVGNCEQVANPMVVGFT